VRWKQRPIRHGEPNQKWGRSIWRGKGRKDRRGASPINLAYLSKKYKPAHESDPSVGKVVRRNSHDRQKPDTK